jgi:hypothetical protein
LTSIQEAYGLDKTEVPQSSPNLTFPALVTMTRGAVRKQDKLEVFTQWAIEQGIQINGIKPAKLPGKGVGIIATKALKVAGCVIRP